MREQLIRYLLGELEANERRELHIRLKADPELREELARLRACLAEQHDDVFSETPPRGLAARTTERVTNGETLSRGSVPDPQHRLSPVGDAPAGILGWSLADLTVAGGVMLAVSMLLFPALGNSRENGRLTVCQNNLQQLGMATLTFANSNGDMFPRVAAHERAGSFVAQLIIAQAADPDDLRVWLICPGSAAGQAIRLNPNAFQLKTAQKLTQLKKMPTQDYDDFTATASPSYAYCLPFWTKGKLSYVGTRNQPVVPLIADLGSDSPRRVSANHRVCQILFSDGHVKAQTSVEMPGVDKNIFLNDADEVAAGVRSSDSVLGPSNARPDGVFEGSGQ